MPPQLRAAVLMSQYASGSTCRKALQCLLIALQCHERVPNRLIKGDLHVTGTQKLSA